MTPLGRALLALDPEMPNAFRRVDEAAGALAPDLVEHSLRLRRGALEPWRATYYFDQPGSTEGDAVGRTFAALAEALALPCPTPLAEALDAPSVLQHVLGVDATGPRLKRYLVFRAPDRAHVASMLESLGRDAPALDAGRVYIVGFDLDASGLSDVKLYFKLDKHKVRSYLRGRTELAPVWRGSRDVVFGHRLSAARPRTMYFHADGPSVLRADLARRPDAHALTRRLDALAEAHPMDPWILGVPYADDAGLSGDQLTVYLHPSGGI